MITLNDKKEIEIIGDGFFEDADIMTCIAKEYEEEFEFLRLINRYMYSLYGIMKVEKSDIIGVFFVETFNKINKDMQAATIIATRGLSEQIKMLVRSILDKLMIMQAVSNDNELFNRWVEHEKNEIYKLANALNNEEGLKFFPHGIPVRETLTKGKSTKQREWAELADMEEDYNFLYRLFSGNVHYSAGSFLTDITIQEGSLDSIYVGEKCADIPKLLITVATYALKATQIVISYFMIDEEEYKKLDGILKKMQKKIQ